MPDIYAATTDGVVYHDQNDAAVASDGWALCRNSVTGSSVSNTSVYSTAGVYVKKWDADQFTIRRSFFAFDISGVGSSDSNCAAAATLKIYGRTYGTADIIAVKAHTSWAGLLTGIATNDFNALDGWNASFTSSDLTAYSAEVTTWSTSGYNDITLNDSALSDMNSSSGVFRVAIMEYDHDYSSVEYNPGAGGEVAAGMYYNHASSAANGKRPYITYTEGSCGYSHSISGVDFGNIGSVIGVAAANIANRSGVDT